MSEYCACGNSKYSDADCCEECWNKSRGYDEKSRDDSRFCKCGAPKTADADMCRKCWNKQRPYGK